MTRVRIIKNLVNGIRKGQLGLLLENDYPEKYSYKVKVDGELHSMYFYADEVEVINEL